MCTKFKQVFVDYWEKVPQHWSVEGFQGTVVNLALQSLHGDLLKNTLKVPGNELHDLHQIPPLLAAGHCTVLYIFEKWKG